MKKMRRLLLLLLINVANVEMHAFSWSLDSIAEMGRFPNFCVKAYRWADWAFNHVDSNYVKPTGYKMNVKVRSQSWAEYNSFFFGLNERSRNAVEIYNITWSRPNIFGCKCGGFYQLQQNI